MLRSLLARSVTGFAAAALLGLAAVGTSAQADELEFTYQLQSGATIAGILDGSLQSDGDTFDVTGVDSFSVNGTAITDALSVSSLDSYALGASESPVATISGSYIDLFITDASTGDAFGLGVGDLTAQALGYNVAGATVGWGGTGSVEVYQANELDPQTVPEPGSWLLLIPALGAFALLRKRAGGMQAVAA